MLWCMEEAVQFSTDKINGEFSRHLGIAQGKSRVVGEKTGFDGPAEKDAQAGDVSLHGGGFESSFGLQVGEPVPKVVDGDLVNPGCGAEVSEEELVELVEVELVGGAGCRSKVTLDFQVSLEAI